MMLIVIVTYVSYFLYLPVFAIHLVIKCKGTMRTFELGVKLHLAPFFQKMGKLVPIR